MTEKLTFPQKLSGQKGSLEVGRMELRRRNLGKAELAYNQQGQKLKLTGAILPTFLKKEVVKNGILLNGDLTIPLNEKDFAVSGQAEIDLDQVKFDLGEVVPNVGEMIFDGNANIKAGVEFKKKKLSTFAKLAINDSRIEQIEKDLFVEGLNVNFEIPDLMKISSSPDQKVSFNSLKYGEMQFGKGDLQLQLESKKVLFLEKSDIEWCDGKIDFGAIRVNFDRPEDLDFTFYCDRIKVAEFLNQLNVAKASGGGRVAGRIPIKFMNSKLEIKNGFLYSTPGEGGRIQLLDIAGTEMVDNSLQLAITKEVLKDYNYKWIRMTFNTNDENLDMRFQLDGAANRKLPFSLDEKGVLVRRKGAQATFHGNSFDFNFQIPVNRLISVGKKTTNLFK